MDEFEGEARKLWNVFSIIGKFQYKIFIFFLKLSKIILNKKFQKKKSPILFQKYYNFHPRSIKNWQSNNDEFVFLVKLACNFYS